MRPTPDPKQATIAAVGPEVSESLEVVILVRSLNLGGAEKQAVLMAHALSARHNSTVLVRRGAETATKNRALADAMNVSVVAIRGSRLGRQWRTLRALRAMSPDVVLALLPSDNLWAGFYGIFSRRTRIYGSIRGLLLGPVKTRLLKMMSEYVFERMFFNSKASLEHYVQAGFCRERAAYIPNAVVVQDPLPDPTYETFRVVIVARFDPAKDYGTALRGFARFRNSLGLDRPRPELLIAGYGPLEHEVKQLIAELDLEECVVFLEPTGELSPQLQRSHVYLSTSTSEGMPNAVMEAMALGLPVVATDVGDTRVLVRDGETGFLIRPRDVAAVAEALVRIYEMGRTGHVMGSAGREHVREQFGMAAMESRLALLLSGSPQKTTVQIDTED